MLWIRLPTDELRLRQFQMATQLRELSSGATSEVIEDLTADVADEHRQLAREDVAGLTSSDFAAIIEETAGSDRRRLLSALHLPALVCCGELDEPNIPRGHDLARRLNTTLRLIPAAGHVANLDAPKALTALCSELETRPG